jgi:hypothetical protein
MLASHKLSEIFVMLSGPNSVAPKALLEAETRVRDVPPPPADLPNDPDGQHLPEFYDNGEAQWFRNTYCHPNWECLLYYSWLSGASGHHAGRGYAANAMQGREATANRTLRTFWWNGSSWATLITESICPGCTAWTTGGNAGGACNGRDGSWYFRSDIPDNGDGTYATVDMADHVYSSCGATLLRCVVNGSYQTQSCGGPRPSPCQAKTFDYFTDPFCPVCADDSCCNPP